MLVKIFVSTNLREHKVKNKDLKMVFPVERWQTIAFTSQQKEKAYFSWNKAWNSKVKKGEIVAPDFKVFACSLQDFDRHRICMGHC